MILTIRTDKPEAEAGLFDGQTELAYEKWEAHRQLAETIHQKIHNLLKSTPVKGQTLGNSTLEDSRTLNEQIAKNLQFVSKEMGDITGIVAYEGPGSYTGLRIGMSVANALAYSLGCGIVATTGDNWKEDGIKLLQAGKSQSIALPHYEEPAKTTAPRK